MNKRALFGLIALLMATLACQTLFPTDTTEPSFNITEEPHVDGTEPAHSDDPGNMLPDTSFPDRPALPNTSGIEGVQTYPDESHYHNHVDFIEEPIGDLPPHSGAHYSAWQNCGIYDQPVEVGNALHSLEHGAVWLTYAPDLSETEVAALRDIVRGNEFVLMSPYPQQTKPVVLSAWTVQLVIDELPDDRIADFVDYFANGPQNPEPGAPCSGALGTPIE